MKRQEYFEITSVCRQDLEELGFDTKGVTDDTMLRLAGKLSDDYTNQLYWGSLGTLADLLGIKKKVKGIRYVNQKK